jgi:negative regulator of flagellin synthesis FlgM
MKINEPNIQSASVQEARSKSSRQIGATSDVKSVSGAPAVQSSASVNLSSLSSTMRGVTGAAQGDIDTARVDAIKQSLANGTFKIDADKIGDAMLKDAASLMAAGAA